MELDARRTRWLLYVALALVGLGLWFFVLRGADEPDDPTFDDPAATVATNPDGTPEPTATTSSPDAPDVAAPGISSRQLFGGFEEVAIAVDPGDGGGLLSWCLLAARTAEQRSQGLIGVSDLQGYDGMAFLYPQDVQNAYHMRNVPRPLSIAWLDADGGLVSTADMVPCTAATQEECPLYRAAGPFRYAIEVFEGGLEALGIGPGSKVSFTGLCAPRSE